MHKDYKITFGGNEYVLNSDDGGLSGSVFELGADRGKVSFAYLWSAQDGEEARISRFGTRLAEGDEIVVDLESAVDAEDNSQILGYDRADDDEPYYCPACKAAEAEAN